MLIVYTKDIHEDQKVAEEAILDACEQINLHCHPGQLSKEPTWMIRCPHGLEPFFVAYARSMVKQENQ